MDPEWQPPVKEINGVNLANYIPHQRSHNSIVFIHKRYFDDNKHNEAKKEKNKPKKDLKQVKYDKSQQFNSDKNTEVSNNNRTYKISNTNDSVLDHTIKFAKTLVPLVIPPSEDNLPVFYTIKSTKKHRKKEKKPQETSFEHPAPTYDRTEPKKVIETYRKVRKDFSVKETASHCSTNTLDDLNINQSLCCTFSEVSEKKYHKKEKCHTKKHHDKQKFIVSESFEALATETPGDSKIKIHLMNEKDKNYLSDSIKTPILTAIRECISELSNCNSDSGLTTVQKILKCNTSKLDTILERITCIEKRLDIRDNEKKTDLQAIEKKLLPRIQMSRSKTSALEELEEDMTETKEDYSSEEELHQEMLDRRSKSAVIELVSEDRSEKKASSLGGGEVGGMKESTIGIKPDRPNRIPTRFCWTDAARK
ncbi:uncharacterized protein LOC135117832 [Helicoverpa armigera]|uniref:uncharacterized protein LOC135117832 n=1 Tax=Helicoverpa armigera TaxID=29058 RepID=UPI003082D2CE